MLALVESQHDQCFSELVRSVWVGRSARGVFYPTRDRLHARCECSMASVDLALFGCNPQWLHDWKLKLGEDVCKESVCETPLNEDKTKRRVFRKHVGPSKYRKSFCLLYPPTPYTL
ncbi:hypothetical protein BaRGS_00004152 [Batillaria attramentaria]|uniref:Uncharacterized protein n=1 Tax=Batillaria attramentaria TaxID=370345 RepID=A0ABD0LZH8_9CAEN